MKISYPHPLGDGKVTWVSTGWLENNPKEKTIICSCGTDREATNEVLLLKRLLKYQNVKTDEMSFTEWPQYPGNPTVMGPHFR